MITVLTVPPPNIVGAESAIFSQFRHPVNVPHDASLWLRSSYGIQPRVVHEGSIGNRCECYGNCVGEAPKGVCKHVAGKK
jgi:hypothetical protein